MRTLKTFVTLRFPILSTQLSVWFNVILQHAFAWTHFSDTKAVKCPCPCICIQEETCRQKVSQHSCATVRDSTIGRGSANIWAPK